MNQTFDFSRWWMLVTMHWVENRKRYLLAMLAMGGLMAGWYSFILVVYKDGAMNPFVQYATYYCGLYFVGCLYASTIFAELGGKAQGIRYLSIPASHLEKLLCGILYGVVLFFIVYTLIYYIVDIPLVNVGNQGILKEHQVWAGTTIPIGKIEVFSLWNNEWAPILDKQYHMLLLGYFTIQSAFLLGSVYFTRYSFIKTIVGILLFWLAFVIFAVKGIEEHLPQGWRTYNFIQWNNTANNAAQLQLVRLPLWMESSLFFLIQYSIPFIFWFIAYIRLKEKEV
ncbi:MAG TPA: hypothetical protein VNS58_29280 [Puia sp.]|nr:hypothetical protein [Puia sp.]